MKGPFWRWALAVVITLGTLVWQRTTGPTYPARGSVKLAEQTINMRLERSNSTASDQPVRVRVADPAVGGSPRNRVIAGRSGKTACSPPSRSRTWYSSLPAAGCLGSIACSSPPSRFSSRTCQGSEVGYRRQTISPPTAGSATRTRTG